MGSFSRTIHTKHNLKITSHIAALEMLNFFVDIIRWLENWKDKEIESHSNNEAAVILLKSGRARDKNMSAISRNIFM